VVVSKRLLGVDIGSSAVHVAEVDVQGKDGRQGALRAYGTAEVPMGAVRAGVVIDSGAVGTAIRHAMSSAGIKTKDAVVGIGATSIAVREVTLPEMPLSQAKKSLALYVEDVLPMPADEAVLDFYPTWSESVESRPTMHGMLVAVSKETATRVLEATERAGLNLQAIDLSAFAIYRSLATSATMGEVVTFVDIGARTTTVAVFSRGVPKLVRYLDGGTLSVVDALSAAGPFSAADAHRALHADAHTQLPPEVAQAVQGQMMNLLDGIRQTIVYYASTANADAPTQIVLTGGGSLINGLPQALASRTRMPLILGDPNAHLTGGTSAGTHALSSARQLIACAAGLTLREQK